MTNLLWRICGLGVFAVLAFDTLASFASVWLDFPYWYASVGSIAIYVTLGYVTFRQFGFIRAVGAAVMVELFDATIGWYISWQIGPGALSADEATSPVIAFTIMLVLLFAATCGGIGSAIARVLHGRRAVTSTQ